MLDDRSVGFRAPAAADRRPNRTSATTTGAQSMAGEDAAPLMARDINRLVSDRGAALRGTITDGCICRLPAIDITVG
jgi:hypothetical protein